jgi:cytochrome P450
MRPSMCLLTLFVTTSSIISLPQSVDRQLQHWYQQSAIMSSRKPTVLDGVYTNEQAERGESYYSRECAQCHLGLVR